MIQFTKVMNNPPKMIASSNNPTIRLLMEWGVRKKPPTLYDYNISLHILHSSTYVTTTE